MVSLSSQTSFCFFVVFVAKNKFLGFFTLFKCCLPADLQVIYLVVFLLFFVECHVSCRLPHVSCHLGCIFLSSTSQILLSTSYFWSFTSCFFHLRCISCHIFCHLFLVVPTCICSMSLTLCPTFVSCVS